MTQGLFLDRFLNASFSKFQKKEFNTLLFESSNNLVLDEFESNNVISNLILKNEPLLVSRIGTTEGAILEYHLTNPNKKIPLNLIKNLNKLSGVYPINQNMARKFAEFFLESTKEVNVLGIRNTQDEKYFWRLELKLQKALETSTLVPINILNPFHTKNPWTYALEGKKVLVVHPFSTTISEQYRHREKLFEDSNWLPNFKLLTYVPPQTLGTNHVEDENQDWFKSFYKMSNEISNLDFDVALIAAGAYGLPLGAEIKKMKRAALHIGGALQLFFGIRGKRWDYVFSKLGLENYFSDYWKYPSENERPSNYRTVEKGAYW